MVMTKNATDLILRDRLQFTADASGDQATVYGRFDLSDFVSALDRKGLSIKEVQFQLRDPTNSTLVNTGVWTQIAIPSNQGSAATMESAAVKVYATTRAYEDAADVGIASPDVLCIEEWQGWVTPFDPATGLPGNVTVVHNKYGTLDLHPDGFPVVTDLLIGIASDKWTSMTAMELDVMLIASPITITQKQLTEMLVQGQDQ
jgi:hypothetical protein